MNIATLIDATIPISVEYTDPITKKTGIIKANVKKASMTPAFAQMLMDLEEAKNFAGLAKELSEIIDSWDLDYNGNDFPPSFENLRRLPREFLRLFLNSAN